MRADVSAWPFKLWTEERSDGPAPIEAETLIVSTGATAKRMSLPGEDTYWQRGISACAVCDGTAARRAADRTGLASRPG